MARKFTNYKIRWIEPILKPTLRADSLRTDSSAQAAQVSLKIELKFSSGADSESLHLELSHPYIYPLKFCQSWEIKIFILWLRYNILVLFIKQNTLSIMADINAEIIIQGETLLDNNPKNKTKKD